MESIHRHWSLLLGIGLGGWFAQSASAGEFAYGLGYVGEYSDNIQRVQANPQEEFINSVVAGVVYRENGPALDAHLQAQAEYRNYQNDIYTDGQLYNADASLLWRISPQQLNWVLVDRYDQITRDVTLPNTPGNQVNANVLNTGPDIYIRLGQVNTLVLEFRYGNAAYSDASLNNYRYGASVRWMYAASTETSYSLNYQAEQTNYRDDIKNDNSLRQDLFLRADRRQARARFLLDLGVTKIDRDRAGETTGPVARLTWAQQLTSESSAGILIASEYLDAGTALLSTVTSPTPVPAAPPPATSTGGLTSDLYYQKRAEVFYKQGGGNIGLNTGAYYRDIDYEIALQDRIEAGWWLDVTYSPSSLLAATVYGSHMDTQYLSNDRNDRENEAGIRFLYRVNRNISATVDVWKTSHDSTDASQAYTDNRVLFSLLYSNSPLFVTSRTRR